MIFLWILSIHFSRNRNTYCKSSICWFVFNRTCLILSLPKLSKVCISSSVMIQLYQMFLGLRCECRIRLHVWHWHVQSFFELFHVFGGSYLHTSVRICVGHKDLNEESKWCFYQYVVEFLLPEAWYYSMFLTLLAFNRLRIRVGGSLQDQVLYDVGNLKSPCHPFQKMKDGLFGFSKGCLHMERWDELNRFFKETG